jgi:hypothetical protein
MLFLLLLKLRLQESRKERRSTMGIIDRAIELQADAYEEMLREYKKIKYELIIKEMQNNEKSI